MEPTRITVEEAKERMDRGEPLVFVDTRNPEAWAKSSTKIVGAIRVPADEVDEHIHEIPRNRTIVTYCT
jgi:rhodanese-related sulfurtransferase